LHDRQPQASPTVDPRLEARNVGGRRFTSAERRHGTRIIAHNQSKGQQQVTINARPTASGTTTVRTDHVDRDNAVVMPL